MPYTLFKVGKVYHYRFQVKPFNRVQRSTRERHHGRADAVARRAYDDAVLRSNGGEPVPTLRQLAADWQALHRPPAISSAHARSVDVFIRLHMEPLADLPLNQLSTDVVERARNAHLTTHAPATANHWLRILKLLVNWGVRRNMLPRLPWKVPMLKVQKRPRAVLPLATAMTWFAALDHASRRTPGVARAVRLMFGIGLREMEAAGARWEWFDWERATYTPGETKGREAEPVPVPDWLLDYLAPLRQVEGLVAPRANGRQLPIGYARHAMQAANAKCLTKGITPHRLRGTFATLLSEQGVPVQTIQAILRHKSPLTTMAYLEKNMETAARGQRGIADKTGLARRKSGEQHPANPHEHTTS
jgi:integrase/recombinase XerC